MGLWTIMTSVPLLLIYEPLWISLPACSWIMHLSFNKLDCPYTRLENSLRRKLGIVTQEPQLLEDRTTFENVKSTS